MQGGVCGTAGSVGAARALLLLGLHVGMCSLLDSFSDITDTKVSDVTVIHLLYMLSLKSEKRLLRLLLEHRKT